MNADIIDFYNGGAQVQRTSVGTDMTHSFTASAGSGKTVDLGYVPKPNSKRAKGAAHDVVTVSGRDFLLLKKGYNYDVKLVTPEGEDDIEEVIGAPEDHVSVMLPIHVVDVEVSEHTSKTKE